MTLWVLERFGGIDFQSKNKPNDRVEHEPAIVLLSNQEVLARLPEVRQKAADAIARAIASEGRESCEENSQADES